MESVELKQLKNQISDKFSSDYVNAVSFFIVLSLSVSVYSLVAASFDRFIAISRPLRYNDAKAIFAAKIAVVFIWFTGIVCAILPIAVPDLGYAFVASNSATLSRSPILTLYSVICIIPVLLMWSSIVATYVAARPSLRKHDKQLHTDHEMRFLGNLGIMITVFTICVLPLAIVLVRNTLLPYDDIRDLKSFDSSLLQNLLQNCLLSTH